MKRRRVSGHLTGVNADRCAEKRHCDEDGVGGAGYPAMGVCAAVRTRFHELVGRKDSAGVPRAVRRADDDGARVGGHHEGSGAGEQAEVPLLLYWFVSIR